MYQKADRQGGFGTWQAGWASDKSREPQHPTCRMDH